MTRSLTLAAMLCLTAVRALAADIQENTDSFGPFGKLHIYRITAQPKQVTLLVSGDSGWNPDMIYTAKSLAELDSMVVGIDIRHYIRQLNASKEKCAYPAAHFEALSQYLQKKYRFTHYALPVLVGYSSGATMVYGTLAQSPPNTFAGGISIGFCPDLRTSKPLCKGNGTLTGIAGPRRGFTYTPVATLAAKLYVLQGDIDHACSTQDTKTFVGKISNAELIELPKVGHAPSVENNWMPQIKAAFQKITGSQQAQAVPTRAADELADLPLVALPAAGKSDTLAVIVSGDGGWASIDKQVAEALKKDGINVVGLNSLQYFWEKKEPDIVGRDLARILDHYGKAWGAEKFILVGYSSGADRLPFMTSRLPEDLKSRVKLVALLGLGTGIDFEFHVSGWLVSEDGTFKVIPEVQKLKGIKVLCIYGEDESDSGCRLLDKSEATSVEMKGGHHFGGDYQKLADIILSHSK